MIALVTGASRGIGRTIALQLAKDGYDLALVGRDIEALMNVKAEISHDIKVLTMVANLENVSEAQKVVEDVAAICGGVDLVVNCAGLSHKGGFETVTPELWDRIFAVNAKAPFFICKAALPYLKQSSRPMVINIASVVGFKGYQDQSVYASSKHALTGFTKVFAKEVQPFGIRVHLISPGGVATEMVKEMRPDIAPDELIQPEEIAEIVHFLVTRKGAGTIDQFYIRRFSGLAFD